ncbi:hypothetical protein JL722_15299 [Aureococcus anophagefferens]|nr:hypothetical protein JL722_15299 [Aureococcus anophagefferens]
MRVTLWGGVLLVGGGSSLNGTPERLEEDLFIISPDTIDVAVTASPGRDVMAWQGGAYLTTLPEFENNWIHVEDREDPGFGSAPGHGIVDTQEVSDALEASYVDKKKATNVHDRLATEEANEWAKLSDRRSAVISLLRSVCDQLRKIDNPPLSRSDEAEDDVGSQKSAARRPRTGAAASA